MARPYHSPSSLKTGVRCARAWAYRYVAGLREPERSWHAFGKAGHAVYEAWYEGKQPDWSSPAGILAHRGSHLLPHPEHCTTIEVERGIGSVPLAAPAKAYAGAGEERALTHAVLAHGIRIAGFRDLLVVPDAPEAARLSLPIEPITHDYKFVADVGRSAMTPADLAADVQACSYALDGAERFGTPGHWCRWMYFQKRGASVALSVRAYITRDQALDALAEPARIARELDTLTRVEDAPQNPAACDDFGGCGYHRNAGGPCDVQRSFGALIQVRTRKDRLDMTTPVAGLDPALLAKFNAFASAPGVVPPPPPPAPVFAPPVAAPAFSAPVAVAPPAAPPPPPAAEPAKRGRKPKDAPPVEAPPAAAPPPPAAAAAPNGKGAHIAALAAALSEAEGRLLAEHQNVANLHAQISAVLAA